MEGRAFRLEAGPRTKLFPAFAGAHYPASTSSQAPFLSESPGQPLAQETI